MACAIFELLQLFYLNFDSFCEKLKKFEEAGVLDEVYIDKEKGIVGARGSMGTAVCLTRNVDPITAFVLLNMMFYGMYFVYMPDYKECFKKVKKWWKENKNKFKPK